MPQSPTAAAFATGQDNVRRNSNFDSPQSPNTSTQSVAGSTPQLPSKELSLSLLQTLLRPQQQVPPQAQSSAERSPMSVSDLETSLGHASISPPSIQQQQQQQQSAVKPAGNPLEQIKRMLNVGGGSFAANSGTDARASNEAFSPQQHNISSFSNQPDKSASSKTKPASVPTSPPAHSTPLITASSSSSATTTTTTTAVAAAMSSKPLSDTSKSGSKVSVLSFDTKKIKIKDTPDRTLISLLQQPARFRSGRLIAVSRDYICYAVRSKEGGRIRVIHQLHGCLAKMHGHTDSIVDMAFHPCSWDPQMPQILASLGKDNRLIVWSVGPVDLEADSEENAIAYEPFINVDSGGDARFTNIAWRTRTPASILELCVSTDKGFMVVKAPALSHAAPAASEGANEGLHIMPVATDSAVTAIACAGERWILAATADKTIRLYELDEHWEASESPYRVVSEIAKCDHLIDTLIYVAPANAADGAGHVIFGHSMNKHLQIFWLGSKADQSTLLQKIAIAGMPHKPAHAFAKISWADRGRCLAVSASHAASSIFVLQSKGHGLQMRLSYPQGYSLGDEHPTLSLVSVIEQQDASKAEPVLSIYSVHTRLVQQLQIPGFKPVEFADLPDPAAIYGNIVVEPSAAEAAVPTNSEAAHPSTNGLERAQLAPVQQQQQQYFAPGSGDISRQIEQDVSANVGEIIKETLTTELQQQLVTALAKVQTAEQSAIKLEPETEARLVERIATEVEQRVVQNISTVMETTLIPAYSRATTAMFEQMQTTFEAGLREWWMRFAQMMPPPPPPQIATPIQHHMIAIPQPQHQHQHQPQPQHQQNGVSSSSQMPMPMPALSANDHIASLKSLLNAQMTAGAPSSQQQSHQQSQ